jgi:acyl CoA:acetate/3-ketoacid CoA transferase alpha subunit
MPWPTDFKPNGKIAERILEISNILGGTKIGELDAATTHVLITASGCEMRFILRGGKPTATSGHRIIAGKTWIMEAEVIKDARFICTHNAPKHGELHITELIERALLTKT